MILIYEVEYKKMQVVYLVNRCLKLEENWRKKNVKKSAIILRVCGHGKNGKNRR